MFSVLVFVCFILFGLAVYQMIKTTDLKKEIEELEKYNCKSDLDYYNNSKYIETLQLNLNIRSQTLKDLKNELVNVKADYNILKDKMSLIEHDEFVACELYKREFENTVFYDQENDVLVSGKDLHNVGRFDE